ncbi:TPA: cell envelope integrity protein CreD [Enterobacter ludwigii]|uniref:cell envelope integrity protein CreD n=1 Tax=Enterobacter TaxID=547 RepID=UPI0015F49FB4|nr:MULTISPECIES: cell envelope integrity protein CreD [Enterobacter]MBA7770153.1 cell envelope integrity protein CreD [Enterobacter sp. RHBSTW-00974]MBA7776433.1 cell envelope integrity protein CreD [Enterobacter sp. RHBSTW-00318]MBA7829892.1 cell envelope integrity protein CreD [Enterobacter sp. RHBSTW-00340]MBA8037693.1 cell envelope integrity protein CreD [Enterobacter sp. RHBSTW-00131]MBG0582952.1 cell envelope integrity protein CreD [Enterobacter ludwigii]
MMKSPLFWKVSTLLGCILLLLVPLFMVSNLISERESYRNDVEHSLRQSTSGPQKLVGPLIAIPVTEVFYKLEDEKKVEYKKSYLHFILPESLLVEGNQRVESRSIGIYDGQIWNTDLKIKAQFSTEKMAQLKGETMTLGQPFLVIGVGDARGIGTVKVAKINGEALSVEPGTGVYGTLAGIHIPLSDKALEPKTLALDMSFNLAGTGTFAVVPVGRNSEMTLSSNWPHPGFMGYYLPVKHQISESGFQANWQSSWFANNMQSWFAEGESPEWSSIPAFSVTVATPADQYQLTDRAIKYAILLIALTFMAFFVFETLTGLRLHPMQYLLVGLSLVLFYLVLLALSEHVGFTPAWIIASLVGAMMNGVYLQAVLKSWRRSGVFILALLGLDVVMWFLLRSEDSALLLGAAVLAMALFAVMYLTRHLDWYSLSQPKRPVPPVEPDADTMRVWK